MAAPARKKVFDIVGESYDASDGTPRQRLLVSINPGDKVVLGRQQDNPHDPNAVVVLWEGKDIGFLSKEDASILATYLDEGREYTAQVHELKGGISGYASYGAKISIAWDGKSLPPCKPLDDNQERSRRGKLAAMKRERDASGAFSSSGAKDGPSDGCLGLFVGAALVGTLGLISFI